MWKDFFPRLLYGFFILALFTPMHAQTLIFEQNEIVAASEDAPINERPRAAFTEDGTSHIVWAKGDYAQEGVFVVSAPPGGDYGYAMMISPELGGVYTVVGSGPTLRVYGNFLAAGWEDHNESNRAIYATRSTNMGMSWEPAIRTDPQTEEERLFQAVGLFPDGRMAQTWLNLGLGFSEPGHDWTGQDSLGIFGEPLEATASAPNEACDCCYADQIILHDGQTVLVAFRNNEENVREIHVVRSTDGGQSFPADTRVDTTGWTLAACPSTGPSLAATGDTVLVSWKSGADNLEHIWMARSLDGGASWEPMQQVDDTDGSHTLNYPQVAIRGNLAVISWDANDMSSGPGIMASGSLDAGQSWGEPVIVTDDTGYFSQTQSTVAISPDFEIEVAWRDSRLRFRRIFHARGWEASLDVKDKGSNSLPRTFLLSQNYPNPFNPSTMIDYTVPDRRKGTTVSLDIFDIRGRRVRTLIENHERSPGTYSVQWDGKDDRGKGVSSGIYLYQIRMGKLAETRRMVISK